MMEREHKEKKDEISNYYKQFNNREKEIRKENWRIGLKNYDRKESREENKNKEDFIQNLDVDFSEKNLLEELYLFIECKVKELKKRERRKRGKKKDQRDMLQKEKNYKKKKLEYRKENKESFN